MALAYATELSLEQYELFESQVSPSSSTGRPRSVNLMRVIMRDFVCAGRAAAQPRLLPNEYPPYKGGLLLLPLAPRRELETYP